MLKLVIFDAWRHTCNGDYSFVDGRSNNNDSNDNNNINNNNNNVNYNNNDDKIDNDNNNNDNINNNNGNNTSLNAAPHACAESPSPRRLYYRVPTWRDTLCLHPHLSNYLPPAASAVYIRKFRCFLRTEGIHIFNSIMLKRG